MLSLDGTMELVIIIYGIAWLLSLLFIVCVCFTEKEKKFRRDNWHVWLLVIAFTPIILLGIILYISVSCIWDKKKEVDGKRIRDASRYTSKKYRSSFYS